jgi:hypothetical protein
LNVIVVGNGDHPEPGIRQRMRKIDESLRTLQLSEAADPKECFGLSPAFRCNLPEAPDEHGHPSELRLAHPDLLVRLHDDLVGKTNRNPEQHPIAALLS